MVEAASKRVVPRVRHRASSSVVPGSPPTVVQVETGTASAPLRVVRPVRRRARVQSLRMQVARDEKAELAVPRVTGVVVAVVAPVQSVRRP